MKEISYKAVFLDRDGIINKDFSYVYERRNFIFNEGIFDLLRIFQKNKFLIFIITNQSGIARGIYSEKQYNQITNYYRNILKNLGIRISGIFHCPHHPDFSENPFSDCNCRKPKPGLFLKVQKKYNINMVESIAIGDSLRDLEAAYLSGIQKRIFINSISQESEYIAMRFETVKECTKYFQKLHF
ncbi:MAG: HAD family hydrolase [Prochlorococcus marinus CUG1437]|nr:HAD family hydrolase [Prochlorococcus marinus CUG1437]